VRGPHGETLLKDGRSELDCGQFADLLNQTTNGIEPDLRPPMSEAPPSAALSAPHPKCRSKSRIIGIKV
jgi:hypothetical protein